MSTAININKITKKFGKRTVLDNLSFEAKSGEVFGLLGPNGAGKTTLIKLITGLLSIDEGEIEIFGSSLEKNYEDAMRNLGAIVENPEMYKYMTGMQNIMQYVRMRKGITPERINEVVEMVGLSNRINEKVGKYSLGMRQRLGVALCLLHNPKILILDEPTNGLDPAGIKQLRDIVRELAHKQNVCVIVSSHLMSEMELMCDRVAIISNGKLLSVNSVEDMIRNSSGNYVTYTYEVSDSKKAIKIAENSINAINKEEFEKEQAKKKTDEIGDTNETNSASENQENDAMNIIYEVLDNTHFDISLPLDNNKEMASSLTALLVENKLDIYSVIPKEAQKLEDVFIEITSDGGDQIA